MQIKWLLKKKRENEIQMKGLKEFDSEIRNKYSCHVLNIFFCMIWPGRPNHDIDGWDLFSKKGGRKRMD